VRRLALVIAATLVSVAACGGTSAPTGIATANPPVPANVLTGAKAAKPTPPEPQTCDPTQSLRPPASQPSPGHMPSGSTMARIVARGRLIVGVDQTTNLFGYRDPGTGQIQGFDIDMGRQIAKAIFGDPNRIQLQVITSAQRIPLLATGKVDLVSDSMTMTCDRWKQVDFSTTYFNAGQRVLVLKGSGIKGIGDLGGKKVCAASGTTSIQTIADQSNHPIPVAVDNWTDCMVMLQQNQVSAVSTDDSILAGLIPQDPNTEMVGPRFTSEPHGLAMAKSNPDLVGFVNGVLAKMRSDGTWAAEWNRWLAGALGPAPAPPAAAYSN
jgi:polar amino acid transport system substrate-binding protein